MCIESKDNKRENKNEMSTIGLNEPVFIPFKYVESHGI